MTEKQVYLCPNCLKAWLKDTEKNKDPIKETCDFCNINKYPQGIALLSHQLGIMEEIPIEFWPKMIRSITTLLDTRLSRFENAVNYFIKLSQPPQPETPVAVKEEEFKPEEKKD